MSAYFVVHALFVGPTVCLFVVNLLVCHLRCFVTLQLGIRNRNRDDPHDIDSDDERLINPGDADVAGGRVLGGDSPREWHLKCWGVCACVCVCVCVV